MSEASKLALSIERAIDQKIANASAGGTKTVTARVHGVDSEGVIWVLLPGASGATPVKRSTVEVSEGDAVTVEVGNGRACITGSTSAPSISAARAAELMVPISEAVAVAGRGASMAWDMARSAKSGADAAQLSADSAAAAASDAWSHADSAASAASAAQASADHANRYANSALDQLSIVQDVAGVLSWASEQGAFVETEDTAIVDGKVYFTFDGTDYTPVVEPDAAHLSDYYELDMSGARQAMNEYILAHLAVTQRGLWVLPSGIGQASDEQHAPGYKMLLASDGAYIYDAQGALVRSDTASGTDFAEGKSFHFGSDDAYILYTPASGGDPASLVIGGANVQLGSSKTLSEWEAEMAQAVSDAAAALDSATLVITSTNGNLFKNGAESTVLQVAVFPNGGGRLDTIAGVRERFGAGAYVEWRWKHDSDGTWGTLPTSDPHISNGGMWLTVGPDDVASKTSFEASLVVP